MKRIMTATMVLIGLTFFNLACADANTPDEDKKQIEVLIETYQKALAKNAKFMPSAGPSAIGTANIKGSYEYVFSLITVNIAFTIDEVVFIGNYAYVTSTSKGTSLIKATNSTVPEINREFFLFEKEGGQWKIARYMFNKMTN
jgi:ketosteroid isomerase-like protein